MTDIPLTTTEDHQIDHNLEDLENSDDIGVFEGEERHPAFFNDEFRSSTGRTREEWKRESKARRRSKRRTRRKIAKRNMYICAAIGFTILLIFVTFIVLIYKSTASLQSTQSTQPIPSTEPTSNMPFKSLFDSLLH